MTQHRRSGASEVSLDPSTVREARDQLARLLASVASGELTAPAGMVARLEGAIVAMDALLGGAFRHEHHSTRGSQGWRGARNTIA